MVLTQISESSQLVIKALASMFQPLIYNIVDDETLDQLNKITGLENMEIWRAFNELADSGIIEQSKEDGTFQLRVIQGHGQQSPKRRVSNHPAEKNDIAPTKEETAPPPKKTMRPGINEKLNKYEPSESIASIAEKLEEDIQLLTKMIEKRSKELEELQELKNIRMQLLDAFK